MEKLFDINKANENSKRIKLEYRLDNISSKDIAVIGMSGRFGSADNIRDFWDGLKSGTEYISELPEYRKRDSENYIDAVSRMGIKKEDFNYFKAGFLKHIDHFDCSMFNISPKEAKLMDPSQRLLLEVIFEAIEDAGYGGKKLVGSRTGVYVGHSNDFGEDYKRYCRMVSSAMEEVVITGNIRSIIGSRISYILDLKGPSITIDTACSSALVAVHTACQAIRSGDCSMAIAGGVKVHIVPAGYKSQEGNIGILSSEERARAFDDSSDGTGLGEGVGAVILKPLSKAIEDGDSIYAIIKGSAVNQDGSSVGITAPNMEAQEDVIIRAWKDANIDPQTIEYIEAHGTGTKLGDPIEIAGIQKAFQHYTDRKQFCAVTSVKTNVGHLDNASGIVSFIKAVMAIKTGELPPSLNFQRPNRKIGFEESSVYVNDRLSKWGSSGIPRRCGISSFGLSGTNCHVVLQEYIATERKAYTKNSVKSPSLFTISARSRSSFQELIEQYDELLQKNNGMDIKSTCYTASTGRGHYNIRMAFIVESMEELKEKIREIKNSKIPYISIKDIYFCEHKIVSDSKLNKASGDITDEEKRALDHSAKDTVSKILCSNDRQTYISRFVELCNLYVKGAEVEWERMYQASVYKKERLPVYPFEKQRHWIDVQKHEEEWPVRTVGNIWHPLLDTCVVQSMEMDVYATCFSVRKHWVLNEHKVVGIYAVPGTAYIEIARKISEYYYPGDHIIIKDIIFIKPLAVDIDSEVEAHIIVKKRDDYREFTVVSKSGSDGAWIKHVEGTFVGFNSKENPRIKISDLKGRMADIRGTDHYKNTDRGPRFNSMRKIYTNREELLAYLELSNVYQSDMEEYKIHPALLDCAVILTKEFLSGEFYLPLSYRNLRIYGKMPGKFYSYMNIKNKEEGSRETVSFSISLIDETGNVFMEIEDYTIKKVNASEHKALINDANADHYFEIGWVRKPVAKNARKAHTKTALVIGNEKGISSDIVESLKEKGLKVYTSQIGNVNGIYDGNRFCILNNQKSYEELMAALGTQPSYIIHLLTAENTDNPSTIKELNDSMQLGVYSLYYLVRALLSQKIVDTELILISKFANNVTGNEEKIQPHHTAFLALGKVIGKEYPGIKCRCIDIDYEIDASDIMTEIESEDDSHTVSYRNGIRYIEEFRVMDLQKQVKEIIKVRNEGVYVITGGTGGIGLEFAQYLALRNKTNICLISRGKLPKTEEWNSILEKNEDYKTCKIIRKIKKIEEMGSNVLCYNSNVADMDSMKSIFSELRNRFGNINGVIHGAGVAGDGFIIRREEDAFRQVLAPKTLGTWILDKLTENDKLDFFVMHSSIASILGPPGQGDYTAANAYLDTFAYSRVKEGKTALSINWPSWRDTGMAVDYGAINEESLFEPITTDLALKKFEGLIGTQIQRSILSNINYLTLASLKNELPISLSDELKHKIDKIYPAYEKPRQVVNSESNKVKVILKGKIEQEYTETENELAEIWFNVLGIRELDIYDNFNDLGGDSILATRLLKEMQKKYNDIVNISDVFTYATIDKMADYIDKKSNRKRAIEKINENETDEDFDLDQLISQIADGNISAEEAEKLISLE